MSAWKMPPKAKVYEAISAVADGRVMIVSDIEAQVMSSAGNKSYTIKWSADRTQFASNDNASFFQGYIGYPIIAVLLRLGILSVDDSALEALKDVPWKALNDAAKRDYDKVVNQVLTERESAGFDVEQVKRNADEIYLRLEALGLTRLAGGTKRPPKASKPTE